MAVAKDILLRLVRAAPPKESGPVRVLGVDELALINGHTYVTILVDLEARQPIDALPGREAEPVARRPAGHPAVEIVCRDRATAYAEAAKQAVKRGRATAGDAPSRVALPESGTGPAPGLSQSASGRGRRQRAPPRTAAWRGGEQEHQPPRTVLPTVARPVRIQVLRRTDSRGGRRRRPRPVSTAPVRGENGR
ncbi:transposase [Streptomyces sp. NPDC056921]|uniref:transposase n=1 Tax=Streptomyces sp. NPDC056921 TaxID=3345966 RepID=UPI0036259292